MERNKNMDKFYEDYKEAILWAIMTLCIVIDALIIIAAWGYESFSILLLLIIFIPAAILSGGMAHKEQYG